MIAKYSKMMMFALVAMSAGALYATDYYWVGGESGNWSGSVWSTSSGGSGETHTFTISDKAIFTSAATVTVDAKVNIKDMTVNAAVTFLSTAKSDNYILIFQKSGTVEGTGSIILGGNACLRSHDGTTTINVPIAVADSTTGCELRASQSGIMNVAGAITGSSPLTVNTVSGSGNGAIKFSGSLAGYTGKMTMTRGNNVNADKFYYILESTAADCSGMTLDYLFNAESSVPTSLGHFPFAAGTEYKFRSLFASIPSCGSGTYTLTLGTGKMTSSSLKGSWGDATANITFASTGTLTNNCANVNSITVTNGGGVAFPSKAGIPAALVFSNGGSLWVADAATLEKVREVMTVTAGTVTATIGEYSKYFTVTLTGDKTADWKGSIVPSSSVYVWCGGESGNFSEAANWSRNGNVLATYETPQPALFTNEVSVTLNADVNMNGACMLYDVTFSGTKYLNQYGAITGTGKITYSNGVVLRNASGVCTVANDVEIPAGATVQFGTHSNRATTWNGAFTGSGTINLKEYNNSNNKGTTVFAGEMGNFEGKIQSNYVNSDSYVQFSGVAMNMANATVVLGSTGNATALCATAGTYTFGSLSGKVTGGSTDATIVTGSLDSEEKSIAYTAGSGSWTLTKKGSQKLTVTGADFANYVLDGGTLVTVNAQTIGTTITTTVSGKVVSGGDSSPYTYTLTDTAIVVDGITISSDWISNNNLEEVASANSTTVAELLASGSTIKATNGYNYFTCYALGLTPTDSTSTPKVTITTDASGNFVVGLTGVKPASGVTVDLKLLSTTDITTTFTEKEATGTGSGKDETFSITPSAVSSVEFFKVAIDILATE